MKDRNSKSKPSPKTAREKIPTDWTLQEIAVLGKMTDAAASRYHAHLAVRLKRISLGITPFGRSSSH